MHCLFMTDSTARQLGYRRLVGIGKPGQWSAGNTLSSVGAVFLDGALLTTGAAVIAS
jgi:hypothetical protein